MTIRQASRPDLAAAPLPAKDGIFLETARLILRRHRETDFPDFCAYAAEAELCRMTGSEPPAGGDALRRAFNWFLEKERAYAMVLRETGQVMGRITVGDLPPCIRDMPVLAKKRGASLSFALSRDFRRRGLMSEALTALISHLFLAENMDYVNCGYLNFNIPSRLLQEKLGFTYLAANPYPGPDGDITAIDNILWRGQWEAALQPSRNEEHTL